MRPPLEAMHIAILRSSREFRLHVRHQSRKLWFPLFSPLFGT